MIVGGEKAVVMGNYFKLKEVVLLADYPVENISDTSKSVFCFLIFTLVDEHVGIILLLLWLPTQILLSDKLPSSATDSVRFTKVLPQ